jgi:hypothetical protein
MGHHHEHEGGGGVQRVRILSRSHERCHPKVGSTASADEAIAVLKEVAMERSLSTSVAGGGFTSREFEGDANGPFIGDGFTIGISNTIPNQKVLSFSLLQVKAFREPDLGICGIICIVPRVAERVPVRRLGNHDVTPPLRQTVQRVMPVRASAPVCLMILTPQAKSQTGRPAIPCSG